jgi:hypothetical protein
MKFTLLFTLIFSFGFVSGQNSQQFIFKFNVKKWNKEFTKQKYLNPDQVNIISLFDVRGNPVLFKIQEKRISEMEVIDLKFFKGKSADDMKILSLTVLRKSMSGAYLENGVQYFIEPDKGCNKYKVYTKPDLNKKIKVGQINDFVK